MHFKTTATILTTTILTISTVTPCTLTIYPHTPDCTGGTYVKYNSKDIPPQCFVAGRTGAAVNCQITADCDNTWSKCSNNVKAASPDKLSFRISKGNSCAWATLGGECAGNSLTSDGECLKGKDYGFGNEMRFRCMND